MKDFAFDTDLVFADGDISVDEDSTQSHQRSILISAPGHLKEYPLGGADVEGYLIDDDVTGMLREVKKQLVADGMTVKKLSYVNGELEVGAYY